MLLSNLHGALMRQTDTVYVSVFVLKRGVTLTSISLIRSSISHHLTMNDVTKKTQKHVGISRLIAIVSEKASSSKL